MALLKQFSIGTIQALLHIRYMLGLSKYFCFQVLKQYVQPVCTQKSHFSNPHCHNSHFKLQNVKWFHIKTDSNFSSLLEISVTKMSPMCN